jgi:predicted HTH domain antitoxin
MIGSRLLMRQLSWSNIMQITIDIPEELGNILEVKWGNLSQCTLESLAVEGYRRGVLTRGQVKRLLNLSSFYEVEQFLKERGADLLYSEEDLDKDIQIVHRLMNR